MKKKKIIVAEDSALMRSILKDTLTSEGYEVFLAKNGKEALDAVKKMNFNAAILDINMPLIDGISVLKEFVKLGIPSIIFSSLTKESSNLIMEAIEIGAIDVVQKPEIAVNIDEVKDELLKRIRAAIDCKIPPPLPEISKRSFMAKIANKSIAKKAVLIAASTGGPCLVKYILQNISSNLGAAVLIVQHMLPPFVKVFVENLAKTSKIPVKEGTLSETIYENMAYVAPGDYHMVVTNEKKILLHKGEKVNFVRPSADLLFYSAAKAFGPYTLAVILSGIGCDGARGALYVKKAGGKVIVQDESTSVVYGMPKSAIEIKAVDEVLSINEIPRRIAEIVDSF
ncbi:MAG: chemotaxis-specific protein-glutamate methyltransferase CheB [Candidatus Methanomethyliaceae archaeon]|nr:chemotaxis-specific protein-glutamate methyltransferase CheB [Candidatus Methanomethyliaceae archaeon]MDW7971297.1 chemotaxis-specific protein-glutamate methyltransferase CheB [Nitrososphaerota archaeon]